MKIFERDGKINFVDGNNVFVGFDYESCCCENFGWFVADSPCDMTSDAPKKLKSIRNYSFDVNYFAEKCHYVEGDEFECGGMVIFRLINKKGKERFLHLYNSHNGYYSHGFEIAVNGSEIYSSGL